MSSLVWAEVPIVTSPPGKLPTSSRPLYAPDRDREAVIPGLDWSLGPGGARANPSLLLR
jgi:hypothetical protein